jgi:hypothetical protein
LECDESCESFSAGFRRAAFASAPVQARLKRKTLYGFTDQQNLGLSSFHDAMLCACTRMLNIDSILSMLFGRQHPGFLIAKD